MAQLDANGDNDDSDEDQEITHSVPFKCIGAAHEKNYQHHLRAEPLNLLDPSAIGIDLDYGTGSCRVGYIASELCKYLHPLKATGDIIDINVQHIKYRRTSLK